MPQDAFKTLYAQLNARQKEAVDAIEGPVMVVAGPGTGKTQILTLRVANILIKTDTRPENILALTFTEAGVAAMRRRLIEIMGAPAYSVAISTFHGFCNDIIKTHPEQFPHIIGSQNITEVDQVRLIEELIPEMPLKELKPFGDPLYYLRSILANINQLKREGVDADDFARLVERERAAFDQIDDLYHEKGPHKGKMKGDYQKLLNRIAKNQELALVYGQYQAKLVERRLYDYSDMIMEVLRALSRNPDLLQVLQEQYQYVLVDEHQDTNNAQNKILELLCNFHDNPNIFVVGDEKQAIFRFQGASLENFLYFKKLYPGAKLVTLEENYRSTQAILDGAHSLLAGPRPLKAKAAHPEHKIRLFSFSRPEVELYFLAHDIKAAIAAGTPAEEIAVLYRDNRDAFPIASILEKSGLPFRIESDQDIMNDRQIRKLLLLLRAVNTFGAQDTFIEALHVDFLHIPPLDIYKVLGYANANKVSALETARSPELRGQLHLESGEALAEFSRKLGEWAIAARNEDLAAFFERFVRESGYLAHVLSFADPLEHMDRLMGLYNELRLLTEARRDCTLKDFFEYLDTLQAHNVLIKRTQSAPAVGRVRLMTAHRSKGQEFEYVYIVNAFDGHWGNRRRAEPLPLLPQVFSMMSQMPQENDNDDERRLFYVALTRAKKGVCLSYARQGANGYEQMPSQFVGELRPELVEAGEAADYEKKWEDHKDALFTPPAVYAPGIKDKEFVKEVFNRNGLSATALNDYLECPWRYFYTHLLRIPTAPTKHQMYGRAIHGALQYFFNAFREREPDARYLLDRYGYFLHQQPLSTHDAAEVLQKGNEALQGYYEAYKGSWRTNVLTEFRVPAVLLSGDIRITGQLDKLEFIGVGQEVNVVDYKARPPMSRNQIEGNTRNGNGNYKRQLAFYNLLLDRFEDGRYRMVSGEIDFVEPDDRGRYRKESFAIAPAEVKELEQLIMQTAEEILNLSFWDSTCGRRDCEYCSLRAMM